MAGYKSGHLKPLEHAKILVLCHVDSVEYGEDWDGDYLRPVKAWLGSANWTHTAPDHLEFGLWTRDEELVHACLEFTLDVLRLSEPLEPGTQTPTPELIEAEWDDVAFAEAAAELEPDDIDQ